MFKNHISISHIRLVFKYHIHLNVNLISLSPQRWIKAFNIQVQSICKVPVYFIDV